MLPPSSASSFTVALDWFAKCANYLRFKCRNLKATQHNIICEFELIRCWSSVSFLPLGGIWLCQRLFHKLCLGFWRKTVPEKPHTTAHLQHKHTQHYESVLLLFDVKPDAVYEVELLAVAFTCHSQPDEHNYHVGDVFTSFFHYKTFIKSILVQMHSSWASCVYKFFWNALSATKTRRKC